jgi:hypothetical protein
MSQTVEQDKILEASTRLRVSWRLMPFLTLACLLCYVERVMSASRAEAGFFLGVILYLIYWRPAEYRVKIVGIFMVAIPTRLFSALSRTLNLE